SGLGGAGEGEGKRDQAGGTVRPSAGLTKLGTRKNETSPGGPGLDRPRNRDLRADRPCSDEPATRVARSGLYPGRILRDSRAGAHARSALADCRIPAATVGLSCPP